jgi:valyl-tRNA synthetase
MEKTFNPESCEGKIYEMWERGGHFIPKIDPDKKPFSIILPLPNASDPMHLGHALFTVEDIMVRFHRMKQEPTLWLPGGDHAGIETQFVFEKYLAKEGKSRFDYDRNTLYQMIWEYTQRYKDINKTQMKRLGFSLDWTRYHYSLEPEIVEKALLTFKKLHEDHLLYRDNRLVNFCTKCGTSFSDLEVEYIEREDPLYYIKYGPFVLATTRPETKFGDTAVAVNPRDPRYKKLIGKEFIYGSLIGDRVIRVVGDDAVDIKFGTGAVKVTPAHDPNDFEIAKRHSLPVIEVINRFGRLNENTGRFAGLTVKQARDKVVSELAERGDLVKVDEKYIHRIGLCYRCKTPIEPLLYPQWYIKVKPMASKAILAVEKGKTKIFPKKRFEKMYFDWLKNITDWNISRQIVWGPRIPVWYCLSCNKNIVLSVLTADGERHFGDCYHLKETLSFEEIKEGLQSISAPVGAEYFLKEVANCPKCGSAHILQETDTFDTWFLSGQWPLTALGYPDSFDYKYFYPTSVLDTLWDILFFWVGRMMMLGIYLTGKPPFKVVHLHSRVVDKEGKKMSKSRGNGVDPVEMIDKYGADALRMALVFGVAPASDVAVSEEKIKAMRNFANKLWNIGRFIEWQKSQLAGSVVEFGEISAKTLTTSDRKLIRELRSLATSVTKAIERYQFSRASEYLYEFTWHNLADVFVEEVKIRQDKEIALGVLEYAYLTCLKLLHPFMPFVTEEIWEKINKDGNTLLINTPWPK